MTDSICATQHAEWARLGLLDYGDFSDGQLEGEWWYADEDNLVVYSGSFGNYNSPGASCYTYAYICEDKEEFSREISHWESQPEYLKDVEGA